MALLEQAGDAGSVPPIQAVAPPWRVRGVAGCSAPSPVRPFCRPRRRFPHTPSRR